MKGAEALPETSVNQVEIEEALEKILRRPEFVASPRQQSFLRFIVDETLADRADRLKAFTIATSIFGRNETFDPQKNSIVRVEALRLRRLLDQYYDGVGAPDPLQIRLRRGSYVPEFIPIKRNSEALPDIRPSSSPRLPSRNSRPLLIAGAMAAAIAVALFSLLAVSSRPTIEARNQQPRREGLPPRNTTISIPPFSVHSSEPATKELAVAIRRDIEDKLSLFDDPSVLEFDAARAPADYVLSGALLPNGLKSAALSLRVTRSNFGRANEIVWSKNFGDISTASVDSLMSIDTAALATTLGQSYGAIHADVRKRLRRTPGIRTGYDCVVLAYEAFDAPSDSNFGNAEGCLNSVLAKDPDFASGMAAQSYLEVSRWLDAIPPGPRDDAMAHARRLARDAARLSPTKARMLTAKFWARFFSGRHQEAFEVGKIALQLNPYAADSLARMGAARMLRGDIDEGLRLFDQSMRSIAATPSWYEFFLFLGAYMKGDLDSAQQIASRSGVSFSPLGLVAQTIAFVQSGSFEAAQQSRQKLANDFPGFAADVRASLNRWQMTPDIRDRLLADFERTAAPALR